MPGTRGRFHRNTQDGDIAQEYHTPIGRIDLLARDRDNADWVVIELKRGRGSDAVVGQLLRYMGWVQENLADEGEAVKGVVIAGDKDDRLHYALKPLGDVVTLFTYTVHFDVEEASL
jgi:RecB family endonuclease NucS